MNAKCLVGAVLGKADPSGPVGRQWRLLLDLLQIFTPLLERGFEVDLMLTGDGVELQGIGCSGGRRVNADEIKVSGQFANDAEYQLAVARAMVEPGDGDGSKAKGVNGG